MSLFYKEHRTIEVHAYSCHLSQEMRDAFQIFYNLYQEEQEKNPPVPQGIRMKDLRSKLTDNQYRNFSKLQYFGIVELERKVYWQLTKLGAEFYLGVTPVTSPCAWMEGKILPETHEAWKTFRGKRKVVYIDTDLKNTFKSRALYEKESRGDTLLSDEQLEAIERGKRKGFLSVQMGMPGGKGLPGIGATIVSGPVMDGWKEPVLQKPSEQQSIFGHKVTEEDTSV